MGNRCFVASCAHAVITLCLVTLLYTGLSSFAVLYTRIAYILLYMFITYLTFGFSRKYFCGEKVDPKNKVVLITGCDTGFGHALAKQLDSRGFTVFAGCLFPNGEGATDLKNSCSNKLKTLSIDVRDDECIKRAVNIVKENIGDSDFWALVNNAGISKGFCIELTSLDSFKETLDVNCLGMVRMTKAFLPLLRRYKGRVVNVTSQAARTVHKGLCAYSMSKHAASAFSECLRKEMKIWGVRVISIEPEVFRTLINDFESYSKKMDEEVSKISKETMASYGEDYVENYKKFVSNATKWASPDTNIVIDVIESAVMDKYPRDVYKAMRNVLSRVVIYFDEKLPSAFTDGVNDKIADMLYYPVPKDLRKYTYRKGHRSAHASHGNINHQM